MSEQVSDPVGEELRRLHDRDEYAELHRDAPRNAGRGAIQEERAGYGVVQQPAPVRTDLPVIGHLVQRDLTERMALGLERYGTQLRAFNGRDALIDVYQELIDACLYLRQALYERDGR